MDALRLPPADADVTTLSGGERRRVALCRLLLQVARPAAARRADQPSRRRVGRVARALPQGLSGHGRRASRTIATSSTTSPAGSSSSIAARGIPWEGNYSSWLEQKQNRLALEEKTESQAPAHARARAGLDPDVAARAAGQGQGAPQRLRGAAQGRNARRRSTPVEIYIPPGPASRRHRRRGARPEEGLRRHAADGRRELHAAARRHRRRDRPQRRRQDHAVPDDHREGAAGRRHAAARRDGAGRLRRPVARALDPDKTVLEEITGGGDDRGARQA